MYFDPSTFPQRTKETDEILKQMRVLILKTMEIDKTIDKSIREYQDAVRKNSEKNSEKIKELIEDQLEFLQEQDERLESIGTLKNERKMSQCEMAQCKTALMTLTSKQDSAPSEDFSHDPFDDPLVSDLVGEVVSLRRENEQQRFKLTQYEMKIDAIQDQTKELEKRNEMLRNIIKIQHGQASKSNQPQSTVDELRNIFNPISLFPVSKLDDEAESWKKDHYKKMDCIQEQIKDLEKVTELVKGNEMLLNALVIEQHN